MEDILKKRDWRYQVMDLPENELLLKVKTMTRLELIEWLSWNDRNGIYRDQDSLDELGNILSKEEGEKIMFRQIMREEEGWDGKMNGVFIDYY